jgi:hypothetical protein
LISKVASRLDALIVEHTRHRMSAASGLHGDYPSRMRKQGAPGAAWYLELLVGGAALVLALVTLAWNDWIELVFKVDPDAGNGSLEKAIVGVLLVAAVVSAWLARTEWRRSRTAAGVTAR